MSDDESTASVAVDARLKFVEEKVCGLLRLQPRTWEKSCASGDFLALVHLFFERGAVIFFWHSNKGCLLASSEVRFDVFCGNIKLALVADFNRLYDVTLLSDRWITSDRG